jgi:hypothetical protein
VQVQLESALESDPTVASATERVHTDDRRLYRMDWSPDICSLCQLLLSSQAILQDASATASHWSIEILYPDRDAISQTSAYCEEYDLSFEIEAVRTLDPEQTTQYGLAIIDESPQLIEGERPHRRRIEAVPFDELGHLKRGLAIRHVKDDVEIVVPEDGVGRTDLSAKVVDVLTNGSPDGDELLGILVFVLVNVDLTEICWHGQVYRPNGKKRTLLSVRSNVTGRASSSGVL